MIKWLIGLLAARLKLVALIASLLVIVSLAACANLKLRPPQQQSVQSKPLSDVESKVVCGDAQAVVLISIPEGQEIHTPDFIQWLNETGRLN
jgi:ABC-type Zn uptake system ZnuABC Zn-binding protein ZnuA